MADQGSEGKLSPFLRGKRIAAALPHIRGRVLDYGCGSGALAEHVDPDLYLGYDPDEQSVKLAWRLRPAHQFTITPPGPGEFNTVVALAVLEHIGEPARFLANLSRYLAPGGHIVLTTPHPRLEFAHTAGALVGLFSREAHDEHEALLDGEAIMALVADAGLRVEVYRQFLAGANQLVVIAP